MLGFASLVGLEFVKVGHRVPPPPRKAAEHTATAGYLSCLFSIVSAEFLSAAGHFQLCVWVLLELSLHLPGWWPDLHPIILPGPFPHSILRALQFLRISYFYPPLRSQDKCGRRKINGDEAHLKKKWGTVNVCGGIVQCKFLGITNREGDLFYLFLLFLHSHGLLWVQGVARGYLVLY